MPAKAVCQAQDICRMYRPHREQAHSYRGMAVCVHFVSGPGQLWERGLPAKAVCQAQDICRMYRRIREQALLPPRPAVCVPSAVGRSIEHRDSALEFGKFRF